MKRPVVLAAVMCLIASTSVEALDELEARVLSVAPTASRVLGYASYALESTDVYGTVSSRLDFPLDGWYAGARGGLVLVPAQGRPFLLDLWWQVCVTQPVQPMKDGDWIQPSGAPRLKFSYTESEARASTTAIGADLSRLAWITPFGKISLGGGVRFHTTDQDALDIEGWQVDLGGTNDVVEIDTRDPANADYDPGILALTYRLTVLEAHGLASLTRPFLPWMTGEIQVFAGPAWIGDRDDHVLRYKLSTASGLGVAGGAKVSLSVHTTAKRANVRSRLSVYGEVYRVVANLEQKQEWYGDEDPGPADTTGMVLTGIGHRVELFNLALGAALVVEVLP